ncbi:hypothetical protein N657DRAFT_571804 [Parathielavia appendiculata]|uniref:N-acetyltransferase ESCO zinc-finger domain-containing protein n=1 Tax=Parathielavia appendiculata TaxID=2587402 RepID=A0AAN6Z4A1_9PEZI|nr:hypothetical protein N657DRAFT_571804 [Parathielavia appendiculata]
MSIDQPATDLFRSLLPATPTSRSRKPPSRTYSRRSVPPKASGDEPPKIDREPGATAPDPGRGRSPGQPPVLSTEKQAEQLNRSGRGSILAYFKPVPSNSDKAQSEAFSSDPIEPPPTSSTSPPLQPRKRRRLTTRPQLSGLCQQLKDDGRDGTDPEDDLGEKSRVNRPRSPLRDETTAPVITGGSDCTMRPALSEVAANTVDCQEGSQRALMEGMMKTKKQPGKRPARDMTQTTLSLSINKEPGFTICGVCDILYNPLNEKDKREHSRRHAAYSRKRRRATT